ncbi:MAG: hypothetical protein FJW30_24080 [Acidobacteria bacterium]|nr:hypothetical protein [Acidobacteriota bacterium]
MRYALIALLAVHGFAHLPGFAAAWRLIENAEMPYRTTLLHGRLDLGDAGIRIYGLCWLALACGFAIAAIGVAQRASWWLLLVEALVLISVLFCAIGWPDTRFGLLANLLTIALAFATLHFAGNGLAVRDTDVDALWDRSAPGRGPYRAAMASGLPNPARRFVEHAIREGTPLASRVKLTMHGEIKLGRWYPFCAEQVITANGEFVWAATVSMLGMPVRGSDKLMNREAAMTWKLFDLFPVASAAGDDVTRSALGRLHGEQAVWLPSTVLESNVSWAEPGPGKLGLNIADPVRSTEVHLTLDDQGRTTTAMFRRWGDPDGKGNREVDFGVFLDEERTFGGFTIPSRIRAGWFFDSERFESGGEFFRATIDNAEYK